jgi:hypothetical protein
MARIDRFPDAHPHAPALALELAPDEPAVVRQKRSSSTQHMSGVSNSMPTGTMGRPLLRANQNAPSWNGSRPPRLVVPSGKLSTLTPERSVRRHCFSTRAPLSGAPRRTKLTFMRCKGPPTSGQPRISLLAIGLQGTTEHSTTGRCSRDDWPRARRARAAAAHSGRCRWHAARTPGGRSRRSSCAQALRSTPPARCSCSSPRHSRSSDCPADMGGGASSPASAGAQREAGSNFESCCLLLSRSVVHLGLGVFRSTAPGPAA